MNKTLSSTRKESYESILKTLSSREKAVVQALRDYGDQTAQEVADRLCRDIEATKNTNRNNAAPRLTELCEKNLVEVVGKRRDVETGRNVGVFHLKKDIIDVLGSSLTWLESW